MTSTTTSSGSESNKYPELMIVLVLLAFFLLDFHLYVLVVSQPQSTTLPISFNSSEYPCYASPFCDINVKALLMDPPNVYIHHPLAKLFNYYFDFANTYTLISANTISIFHVLIALVAGRLISHDSLFDRRIGVLLFEIRNYLDALDGAVAIARRRNIAIRTHHNVHNYTSVLPDHKTMYASTGTLDKTELMRDEDLDRMNQDSAQLGYYLDGFCDGIGCAFIFLGCFLYLQKHPMRTVSSYNPIPLVVKSSDSSGFSNSNNDHEKKKNMTSRNIRYRASDCQNGFRFRSRKYIVKQLIRSIQRAGLMAVSFGLQSFLGSVAWNRCISNYTRILEDPNPPNIPNVPTRSESQHKQYRAELLHSNLMWFVFLMWRYINPHAMVEVLLVAIFFDKMGDLLSFLRFFGYVPLLFAAGLTEVYMYSIELN